jgi:iron complex outermembrane receptor protein
VINGTLASGRVLSNFQPVDDVRVGNIEGGVPKWRGVLSSSYRNGIFDATARVNYYGSYISVFDPITTGIGPTPSVGVNTLADAQALYPVPFTREFGAQAAFDLEVGLTFADKYRIAVGAQNLFNTFPERETRNVFTSTGGAANGSIYNDFAPIGQLGGFWYARVSASF